MLNLASQKGITLSKMGRFLGRIRKGVSYLDKSSTAARVLKTKQVMLQLPTHKLKHDVTTDKNLKKNVRDIVTLSDNNVRVAEEVPQLLKPLKVVTTLLNTALH